MRSYTINIYFTILVVWGLAGGIDHARAQASDGAFMAFIESVERQTGYTIGYALADMPSVTGPFPDPAGLTAEEVLRKVLPPKQYALVTQGRHIIILKSSGEAETDHAEPSSGSAAGHGEASHGNPVTGVEVYVGRLPGRDEDDAGGWDGLPRSAGSGLTDAGAGAGTGNAGAGAGATGTGTGQTGAGASAGASAESGQAGERRLIIISGRDGSAVGNAGTSEAEVGSAVGNAGAAEKSTETGPEGNSYYGSGGSSGPGSGIIAGQDGNTAGAVRNNAAGVLTDSQDRWMERPGGDPGTDMYQVSADETMPVKERWPVGDRDTGTDRGAGGRRTFDMGAAPGDGFNPVTEPDEPANSRVIPFREDLLEIHVYTRPEPPVRKRRGGK